MPIVKLADIQHFRLGTASGIDRFDFRLCISYPLTCSFDPWLWLAFIMNKLKYPCIAIVRTGHQYGDCVLCRKQVVLICAKSANLFYVRIIEPDVEKEAESILRFRHLLGHPSQLPNAINMTVESTCLL